MTPAEQAPRVGLVLNGGAARAVTSLGVLSVLRDVCTPHCVVGQSAGALVGLLLVLGYSPEEMVTMLKQELAPRWLKYVPGGSYLNLLRVLRGGRLRRSLARYCPERLRLEDLTPRLVVVCSDLVDQRRVLLDHGPAAQLVVASCSLPGFGTPLAYDDMLLVDGMVTNQGHWDRAQLGGVDLLIGVDVNVASRRQPPRTPPKSWLGTLTRSWQAWSAARTAAAQASYDMVILPEAPFGVFDLDSRHIDQLFELGREAAHNKLPELHTLLAERRDG